MKAILWTAYGPPEVLKLAKIPKPVPRENEVLIRIKAANVTAGDCEQRALKLPFLLALAIRIYTGILRPTRIRVLGFDLSGEVESVGPAVTGFKPGDRIYGTTGFIRMGTYAEYVRLPVDAEDVILDSLPDGITWEEAAGVPTGALEALHFSGMAKIKPGMTVLIIGAAGTIGSFMVQLVKTAGAHVTAVDAGSKLEMLRELGADETIDYTREHIYASGKKYDVVLDIAGRSSMLKTLRLINKDGRCILVNPAVSQRLLSGITSSFVGKKLVTGSSRQDTKGLRYLSGLLHDGLLRSRIDRTFPLEQAAEAHRYVETGKKLGNVVLVNDA